MRHIRQRVRELDSQGVKRKAIAAELKISLPQVWKVLGPQLRKAANVPHETIKESEMLVKETEINSIS